MAIWKAPLRINTEFFYTFSQQVKNAMKSNFKRLWIAGHAKCCPVSWQNLVKQYLDDYDSQVFSKFNH